MARWAKYIHTWEETMNLFILVVGFMERYKWGEVCVCVEE
jgi:hypothetical protein